MKRRLIVLLPLALGVASIACSGLYVRNHGRAWQIIRETRASVPPEDFDRVVQPRLQSKVGGLESYHIASFVLAVLAIGFAALALPSWWYTGLRPGTMKVVRSGNLVLALVALLASMIIV